jgi:Tol biopolymer transport system component
VGSAALVVGVVAVSGCQPIQPWRHTVGSGDSTGTVGGNGFSSEPTFSPDGAALAFVSTSSDLGPADEGDDPDVYVRDLATGTNTLVSVDETGAGPGNGSSAVANFSPDGTKIAFQSLASDLVTPDTNDTSDVFVRDLTAGTTTMLSRNAAGTDSGNSLSYIGNIGQAVFSADGTRAVFTSGASDLGGNDTNLGRDVYVRDLTTGTTSLVSVNEAGTASGEQEAMYPRISPDGTKVAFTSTSSDLEPITTSQGRENVFVRDLVAGTTTLVSVNADGTDSGDLSSEGTFGADPDLVAFVSSARDLGPANSTSQVFLAHLTGGDLSVAVEGALTSPSLVAYEVDVANAGPDPAGGASVALLLPEQATFVDADSPCTPPTAEQPRLVTCPLGTVAPGARPTIGIRADVAAPGGSTITAVAAVSSPTIDPAPRNNTATSAVLVP